MEPLSASLAPSPPDDAAEPPRPSPWMAAAAGFLLPVMGYVDVGRAMRGVVLYAGVLAVAVVLIALSMAVAWPALRLPLLVGAVVPPLAFLADPFRLARAAGARQPRWIVLLAWLVPLLLVATTVHPLVRTHLVEAFRIPGASMAPALLPGDYVLVSRHRGGPVRRGSVVVHVATGVPVVARVVGLPGDTWRCGRGG